MLCTKLIIRDKKTLSISPLEVINILCYNHQCICLKALVVQRIEQETPKLLMQVQFLPRAQFESRRAYSKSALRFHGMEEGGGQFPVGPQKEAGCQSG